MLGWFDESEIKNILHIPRSTRIALLITLGYSADNLPAHAKTRKAVEVMSSRNSYD
jgi:nitroreductase